jgi:Arc/MetJ-type ribon-helix-helix transcriptional regulator
MPATFESYLNNRHYNSITMVMDTLQIRLSSGLVEGVDSLVDTGLYANRSDAIRDAVRRLVLTQMAGIIPNKTDSIKEVRHVRKKLSNKKFDLAEINKLVD